MSFEKWWKKLSYWKKGGLIGFVIGLIVAIIMSFQIGECWLCILFELPAFFILGNIPTYPGPPLVSTLFVMLLIILPYAMVGTFLGFLYNFVKK